MMVASARISNASFFVLCTALDLVTYQVPRSGGSIAPFDSKFGIKVIFEEDTFGDENTIVEFKVCFYHVLLLLERYLVPSKHIYFLLLANLNEVVHSFTITKSGSILLAH